MSRKPKVDKKAEAVATLERIKKLPIVAMFSDDELLDELVLSPPTSHRRAKLGPTGKVRSSTTRNPWHPSPTD